MSEGRTTRLPKITLARDLPRWGLAAALAVGAHAAVAAGVVAFAPEKEAIAMKQAMTVELQPLVISEAQSVDQVDTVAALQPEEVVEEETPVEEEVETTEEEIEDPVEEAVEEPVVETEAEDTAEEVVEETPEEVIEEAQPAPEVKKAEVVLPKPKPAKKKPEPKVEKKKVEKPVVKPVKKAESKKVAKASSTQTSRASSSAGAPRVNPSAWYSKVNAAVARRKPRSLGASGRVVIRFVVNSSGGIISSSIASSSGNARLDSAALAMARGRVPAPPAGLSGSSFPFTLPVTFR